MLDIINSLTLFFEDCYARINVREYARLQKISPPTASKQLKTLREESLLKLEKEKQYFYYYANKDSDTFTDLSRIYWRLKLENAGLLDFFEKELLNPVIILFGSLSKSEVKPDSDIDLAIFTPTKKELTLEKYEKNLKRKIQLFIFSSIEQNKNIELQNNILNGYKLRGDF